MSNFVFELNQKSTVNNRPRVGDKFSSYQIYKSRRASSQPRLAITKPARNPPDFAMVIPIAEKKKDFSFNIENVNWKNAQIVP